jgi:exo-beta-1,3-glucanase (GH17 family)
MIRLPLLFIVVAAAIAAAWYSLGQPVSLPGTKSAQGRELNCLSYAPFRGEQAPYAEPLRIPDEQIVDDLRRLAGVTACIRTYSAAAMQGKIVRIADELGLRMLQGIWISRDPAANRREIESALRLARHHPRAVQALIVGNEVLLRGEQSPANLKDLMQEVRRRSGLPVTYADVWEYWLKAPELASVADFITIHILPFWEDHPVEAENAVEHVREIRSHVAKVFADKDILIGEVGWPSAGRMREGALPSRVNQAIVWTGVVDAAKAEGWRINLIEAFDQPWKRDLEGTVGGYWGLFDSVTREPKFRFGEPVSNHPQWALAAGLGIMAAAFVFFAAWLANRSSAPPRWDQSLAVAAIALGGGLVFGAAAIGLSTEPPHLGDRLRSAAMLALSLMVPVGAAMAVMRKTALPSIAVALNAPLRRHADIITMIFALLFAATLLASMHVGLGLVFNARYNGFQLVLLSGPAIALAIAAFIPARPKAPGLTERVAATVLALSAMFVVVNEGTENWQALWFAALLLLLAATTLKAVPVPVRG